MTQLSTNPFYAIIVFHDKSKKTITKEQYKNLVVAYSNPDTTKLQVGESLYSKQSISKILTLEEFYQEYPDQKPDYYNSIADTEPVKFDDFRSDKLSKNGLVSMIRGIKRVIKEFEDRGHNPTKAKNLLDRAIKAYKEKYPDAPTLAL